MKKITVIDMPMQKTKDQRIIMNWLLSSLGVISREEHGDKYTDLVMFFASKSSKTPSSTSKNTVKIEEIQKQFGIPRSTAYKYVGRLIDSGMVRKVAMNEYSLSDGQLIRIIEDIRRDVNKILDKVAERANQLDNEVSFV